MCVLGQFIQEPQIDIFKKIYAASLLLSAADFFHRPAYRTFARKILTSIEKHIYRQNQLNMIVIDGNIRPVWDGLYAHCLYKLKYIHKFINYCHGIFFLKTHRDHNGILIAAFLNAFHLSENEEFLDWAKKVRTIIYASERLSSFDAWGIALLDKIAPDEKSKEYIERMLKTSNITPRNMSGAMGPIVLQICSAYKYLTSDSKYDERIEAVLEYQKQLQVTTENMHGLDGTHFGAFVQSIANSEVRLDYTISSCFAFMGILDPTFCF